MRPLGTAIDELVKSLGIGRRIKEYDAVARWDSVVGAQIAKVTKAESIRKGVLLVRVSNGPWRNELQFRKSEMILKLNEELGDELVKDIRFV